MPREITCNESGVWVALEGGVHRSGIAWSEIYAISGHKLDCVTEVLTVVVLDFSNGHFVELISDDIGFDAAVAGVAARVPGLPADWFAAISDLGFDDLPLRVWCKGKDEL